MALTTTPLPFGLRDVKIRPLTGETAGTSIDLPNARTFSFSEKVDSAELRGDDGLVAVHDASAVVDWSLEAGGAPLEAIKAMYGGTISETGVTPNIVKTYSKLDTDSRPYFQVEGQAISDSGGDFHILLYRCKATGQLDGTLTDGNFWLTGASGTALAQASNHKIWDFVQHETATSIT